MPDFKILLEQPGILVADGATGTMLQKFGLPSGAAPERWNLENPDAVYQLYQAYVNSGSDVILTNTFGGTRIRLERDNLGEKAREINLAAARLARKAAADKVLVFGDIGPTGALLMPLGTLQPEDAVAAFAEQASGLAEGGADAILIETMSDLEEAKCAIVGVREVTDLPILVSFSFDTRGRTMMGLKPGMAAEEIWALGVTAVGANCGRTLSETLQAIQAMHQAVPDAILFAKPNAGLPHSDGDDLVYDVTPEIMAEYAVKFSQEGVKIFGGCCGSTPAHIQAVANVLKRQ